MKKILFILQTLLILSISVELSAQIPSLKLTVIVVDETQKGQSNGEINLQLQGDKPPFKYQLFDKAPWDGGKEIAQSPKTDDLEFSFKNLTSGSYFVCVTDNENSSDCEIVMISNN